MTGSCASFCWWCGKKLQTFPNHTHIYEVKLLLGGTVRVHKTCQEDAQKSQKHLTADEKQPGVTNCDT